MHEAIDCGYECKECESTPYSERIFISLKGNYDGKYFYLTNEQAEQIYEKYKEKHETEKE